MIPEEEFIQRYIRATRRRGYRDPDVDLEKSAIETMEILMGMGLVCIRKKDLYKIANALEGKKEAAEK